MQVKVDMVTFNTKSMYLHYIPTLNTNTYVVFNKFLIYFRDGNHLEITKEPNDNKDMLTSESFHWQIVHYEPRVD